MRANTNMPINLSIRSLSMETGIVAERSVIAKAATLDESSSQTSEEAISYCSSHRRRCV